MGALVVGDGGAGTGPLFDSASLAFGEDGLEKTPPAHRAATRTLASARIVRASLIFLRRCHFPWRPFVGTPVSLPCSAGRRPSIWHSPASWGPRLASVVSQKWGGPEEFWSDVSCCRWRQRRWQATYVGRLLEAVVLSEDPRRCSSAGLAVRRARRLWRCAAGLCRSAGMVVTTPKWLNLLAIMSTRSVSGVGGSWPIAWRACTRSPVRASLGQSARRTWNASSQDPRTDAPSRLPLVDPVHGGAASPATPLHLAVPSHVQLVDEPGRTLVRPTDYQMDDAGRPPLTSPPQSRPG